MIINVQGELRNDDSCISVTSQVHALVLQLREFFIEPKQSPEIFNLGHVITWLCLCPNSVSYSCWSLDVQDIGLLVPIMRIMPKIGGVSHKGELSFGVEPAVQ